ncbi:MAG: tRNA lysidine(34) synthetase TilS [Cereibacter sphaeroides]|uniref:tRNA(Ile)-lysidine synthase n=1 Tax=Cereibacter sphaeroides TaxID=1063 RepID=A0A2W5UTJ4_CERSP|nr:MAG: tRNA lysidine(34) synthetase TilS [Cereibacter sphaeroides]
MPDRFRTALGPVDVPLGLAVSGGGDSVAMLCLAMDARFPVSVVTVDHGLRAEAAAEAEWVGRLCARFGVPHKVLRWREWDGSGNLQDQARRARLRLISDWAKSAGIEAVALGHTQDDQAETVLLRLARRAGVDGLAAMAPTRRHLGVQWLRPLLAISREELRDYLHSRDQDWIEDPSNQSMRFDRVKARVALGALASLGIDNAVLAGVARQMAEARTALEVQTTQAAREIALIEAGDVVLDRAGFLGMPPEIQRRLLVAALAWVGSAEYGPRAEPVRELIAAVGRGKGGPLAGCRVLCRKASVRVTREAQAVIDAVAAPGVLWDHRWIVTGAEINGLQVRALGEAGLRDCPDWRETGFPRASLLASPAVWRGKELVAAPLARPDGVWQAKLAIDLPAPFLSALSH